MIIKMLSLIFLLIFLSLSNGLEDPSVIEKLKPCEYLGTLCTDDCTGLVACTVIGENPIEIKRCDKEVDGYAYCKQVTSTLATCSGQQQDCIAQDGSEGIRCGAFGEFPHPQRCDMTVRCQQENEPPSQLCHCPLGYYINIVKPSLPCEANATLCNSRQAVNCTYAGQNGAYPGSSDFCYACGDGNNTDTYVYHCESTRSYFLQWLSFPTYEEPKVAKACTQITPPGNRSENEESNQSETNQLIM